MSQYIDVDWDISQKTTVDLRIHYECEEGVVFIDQVEFDFDGRWMLVPQDWRNENLENFRQVVLDGYKD